MKKKVVYSCILFFVYAHNAIFCAEANNFKPHFEQVSTLRELAEFMSAVDGYYSFPIFYSNSYKSKDHEIKLWLKTLKATYKINLAIFDDNNEPESFKDAKKEYERVKFKIDRLPLCELVPGTLLREFEWAKQDYDKQKLSCSSYLNNQRQYFHENIQQELRLVLTKFFDYAFVDFVVKDITGP